MKNWLSNWIKEGLDDWCVSRDAPYFGFEIPGSEEETGEKKFFYVWLDAPIGYISSTKNLKNNWKDYWYKGKVQHFIGKDIAYFHFLFWPAMLMAVGIPLPKLTVHGWVTVNGQKMSKSRGTFFTAKDFLKLYPAESLRFYYAQSLDRKVVDTDLNLDDFQAVVNNVLVANLGNFCYRTLIFAEKNYGQIENVAEEKELVTKINALIEGVKNYYYKQNFKLAIKEILKIADLGNIYFQNSEVWKDKDSSQSKSKVGFCVNLARNLAILINPVLPEFSKKVYAALNEKELFFDDINFNWKGKLNKTELLVEKIEKIPKEDLFPIKMVVGQIKEVNNHPDADTLYLMKVDLGKELGIKQVVAGLKKYFSKEDLINKKAVFCANLKPAKLRGEMSEAMVFAAEDKDKNISLLNVIGTEVGEEVHFGNQKNNSDEISFDDFIKIKMVVKESLVYCNNEKLSSTVEDVKVTGIKDGGKVC